MTQNNSLALPCIVLCHKATWVNLFKILLLTFKSFNYLSLSHISDLLQPYKPSRSLQSSTMNLLVTPKSRLKFYGDRVFWVCFPKLHIKYSLNLTSFKSNLKKLILLRTILICSFAISIFWIYYFPSYCLKHLIVKHCRALEWGAIEIFVLLLLILI